MPRPFAVPACGVALICLAACQGEILGGGGSASPPLGAGENSATAGSGGTGGGVTPPAGTSAGPRPLRRLTRVEYENTVRDLLQLSQPFAAGLPDDARGSSGYAQPGPVGEVDAQRLQDAAAELSELATAAGLPALLGCAPDGSAEAACVTQFVRAFGRRAFRRPLTDAERLDLEALYRDSRENLGLDASEAAELLVSAVLQAPQFLYLWERTTADDPAVAVVPLGPHELASRLSYLLWRSMPDAALAEAADGGHLATPAALTEQARRLLADARAQDSLVEFVRDWFHLPRRSDDALSSAANGETALFVKSVMASGGTLQSLLTSPTNFVNATLAPLYGAAGVEGDELRALEVNPELRFGLLTQISFLGTNADGPQSHPVKRGAVILEQLLCGELPALPDDIPQPDPPRDGVPNRVRFAAHGQNACATGCHRLLDPLGFAFEHYDGTGRYRTSDAGLPIEASGAVELFSGSKLQFQGARDLVEQLATSAEVRSCAARQALRLALDRRETSADEASLAELESAFAGAGYDLRELLVAAVTAPSFTHRAASIR